MSVANCCRRNPVTAAPGESVRDAAVRMESEGVGCLVVVEDERPVGILTDRDIVMRVLRKRLDANETMVADVMNTEVAAISEEAPVSQAFRFMRREGVRRIPVTDASGRLTGMMSIDDGLQLLAAELGGVAEAVRAQFPADLSGDHALPS